MRKTHLMMILACVAGLFSSCTKEENDADRSEYVAAYATLEDAVDPEAEPLNTLCVGVLEGDTDIYVKTNTELTPSWQDALTSPWASVKGYEQTGTENVWKLTLHAKCISTTSAYYTRRSGTLLLSNPELNFGLFLPVCQGSTARVSCNFASLVYGSNNPLDESGETLMSKWSASIKSSYKFTSTPFAGGDVAYVYGKNGYLKLGDGEGHGADLISPYADAMRADSLLMVTFNAIAYVSKKGEKDANKFTVEVTGGGVFADDSSTKMECEASYYDIDDANFPTSIWKDAQWMFFVKSTELNPITANTQIKITAGDLKTAGAQCSRLLVDNFYIRTLNPKVDEDYFTENGGSGRDNILAPGL